MLKMLKMLGSNLPLTQNYKNVKIEWRIYRQIMNIYYILKFTSGEQREI